jgi:thiamine biosynthesis lipoprotein
MIRAVSFPAMGTEVSIQVWFQDEVQEPSGDPAAATARPDRVADTKAGTQESSGGLAAATQRGPEASRGRPAAGVTTLLVECRRLVERLEALLSRFRPGSDVSRLNRAAGAWVDVDPHTDAVLQEVIRLTEVTAGAFQPLCLTAPPTRPTPSDHPDNGDRGVMGGRGHLDGRKADGQFADQRGSPGLSPRLDRSTKGRYRLPPGATLDLGGIAKGYAADQVRDRLREAGAAGALVSLGTSSIAVLGTRPDGAPWRIGLRNPSGGPDSMIGSLPLVSGSLSTSGDYERTRQVAGQQVSHIVDPRTGGSPRSGLRSVTVLAPTGTTAEALSTAFLVIGADAAAKTYANGGFEAILVTDQTILATRGLRPILHLAAQPWQPVGPCGASWF